MKQEDKRSHGQSAHGRTGISILKLCFGAALSFTSAMPVAHATAADDDAEMSPDQRPAINLYPQPLPKTVERFPDQAVYLNVHYTGEFADNPVGGVRQANAYNSQILADAIVNLGKIAGIKGGSIHATFTERMGQNLSGNAIDSNFFVQQLYGSSETYILSRLAYDQFLFHDKLKLEAGRIDLSNNFDRSQFYCYFQSDPDCGNPNGLAKDITKANFPVPVWGATVTLQPIKAIYVKAGVFQVNPTANTALKHGVDWAIAGTTGYTLPIEVGYKWRKPGALDDNKYDVGIVIDQSPATFTVFGKAYDTPSTASGRKVVYAEAQQMVWQAEPNSKRGIYLVGNAIYGASGAKQPERFNANLNMVWQGPFKARPNDYIGMVTGWTDYNRPYLNALFEARRALGGTQQPHRWVGLSEINYSIKATPWLRFLPNVQWMIHPNGLGFETYTKSNVPNAVILGLQLDIGLTRMVGIGRDSDAVN